MWYPRRSYVVFLEYAGTTMMMPSEKGFVCWKGQSLEIHPPHSIPSSVKGLAEGKAGDLDISTPNMTWIRSVFSNWKYHKYQNRIALLSLRSGWLLLRARDYCALFGSLSWGFGMRGRVLRVRSGPIHVPLFLRFPCSSWIYNGWCDPANECISDGQSYFSQDVLFCYSHRTYPRFH